MKVKRLLAFTAALAVTPFLSSAAVAANNIVANPICPDNTANFNPTLPPSIVLPSGFTASVFVSGLNFPTGIAFLGDSQNFQVFVLESGHGLLAVLSARPTLSHPTSWSSTETGN